MLRAAKLAPAGPLALLTGGLALLAGCGSVRTADPNLSEPASPVSFRTLGYPKSGFTLMAPSNWVVAANRGPLITTVSSGAAVVAVWRFPRTAPAPAGAAALGGARAALIRAARARDPALQVIRSRTTIIDHRPAVVLDAFEQVGGEARRVRSTHVFTPGAELVLDEYAPPGMFHTVDHTVFSPLGRSLHLRSVAAA